MKKNDYLYYACSQQQTVCLFWTVMINFMSSWPQGAQTFGPALFWMFLCGYF